MAKIIEKSREDSDKVRIFSNRQGDIICKDGIVIKFESVTSVDKDLAEYLIKSHPEHIKRVD